MKEQRVDGDQKKVFVLAKTKNYSTALGAVYPAFVITVYFTGFPFSVIFSASPV